MRFLTAPIVVLLALACAAHAQVQVPPSSDPSVIQQREMEREKRLRDEELRRERIERPLKVEPPKPAPGAPGADELRFFVREIVFEPPSELLKPEELEALAAPYRGRTLRLADLRELVAKVNELYKARGVATAQASLPPQDVSKGVVRIRLVEGRVGQLRIERNATTNTDYITDRLRLKPSMLVDLNRLEEDMIRFNRTNDAQLAAELKPGEAFGQTDVVVTVTEPKRHDWRLFVDNSGSAGTGELRLGTAYQLRSLTGRRDDLYASVVEADGHFGKYLTYGTPLNTLGTRLNLGYFHDRTRIVHGLIAALNVTGEATAATASLRHPLLFSRSTQVDGVLSLKKRHTVNWIDGTLLSDANIDSRSLALEAQSTDDKGYWAVTNELVSGTNAPLGAERRPYHVARGTVRRSYSVSQQTTLIGSFGWQYTSDQLLPPSEQFLIGGESTVRGFGTGMFAGDRGLLLNLEAHRTLPLPQSSALKGSAFVFFDYGEARPFRPPGSQRGADMINSGGAGLNFSYAKDISGKLILGVPFKTRPEEARNYRVHFQFVWHIL